jgi:hypothetical protein
VFAGGCRGRTAKFTLQEQMFCSEADEDCLQQWKIYLKTTMSSA